ncbi:MAG: DNA-directed RNA polymerase subunit alpha [Acidobacteria bacterium]|nr:DNA-directed RNA polymerase subunit alpha [Acidobacteriota bacterium]
MLIVQRPQIVEEPITDTRWKFAIEPLEPGFGYTLGNVLRRTLLSSIPGAAVTQIRIDGVLHEFSSIEGVKEDVTDIILNIKDLVIRSTSDEPIAVHLRVQGPKEVTGADIECPSDVEILNPQQLIATINRKARLDVELMVERGRGYVSAERNKRGRDVIGPIPIDSIFSPVRRVFYAVEATRVEQMTNFDKLVLDVETNGAVSPKEAVAAAGRTLVDLLGLVADLSETQALRLGPAPEDLARASDLAQPIEDMDLSVRSYNCLRREGVQTVGELIQRTEQDLLDIRNFGQKSIDEVKQKLAEMGLALREG